MMKMKKPQRFCSAGLQKDICLACLSVDRKLYKLLEYKGVFKLICKDVVQGIHSEIFLCFECLALLRNVTKFQEKVQKSQYILKSYREVDVKNNVLENLSNLSITKAGIFDCSNSVDYDEAKPNLDIKPEEEDYNSDDFNTFDNGETLGELGDTKIYNSPESNLSKPALETKANINEECIEDEIILKDEHLHKINNVFGGVIKKEEKDPHSDSIFMASDRNVMKKEKKRYFLSKDRSELYKFVCPKKTLANVHQTLKIPYEEINYWLEKERNSSFFKRVLYKCEKCARRMSKKKLQGHKRRHTQNSESYHYTCDYCSLSFKKEVPLINHINKHCYIRCCNNCGFKCINISNMYAHVKKEHGTRAVQCLQCQTNFRNTRLFYQHYHKDHYELSKTFICDYCNKKFASRRTIEKHIFNNHTTHPCTKCPLTFPTPSRLKQHYTLKHSGSRSEASYCVKCDRQFDNVPRFRNHLHYAVAHREEKKTFTPSPSKQPVKCLACPNVYSKRSNMMYHYNKVHIGITKYHCADCDKIFFYNKALKDHIKHHHEGHPKDRNHICYVCGRGFTVKKILTNHLRTHTGERPFECPHCDSKFAQKYAMLTHVKKIHRKM